MPNYRLYGPLLSPARAAIRISSSNTSATESGGSSARRPRRGADVAPRWGLKARVMGAQGSGGAHSARAAAQRGLWSMSLLLCRRRVCGSSGSSRAAAAPLGQAFAINLVGCAQRLAVDEHEGAGRAAQRRDGVGGCHAHHNQRRGASAPGAPRPHAQLLPKCPPSYAAPQEAQPGHKFAQVSRTDALVAACVRTRTASLPRRRDRATSPRPHLHHTHHRHTAATTQQRPCWPPRPQPSRPPSTG